jgi:hypothetical protein
MSFRHADCTHDPSECRITRSSGIKPPLLTWSPVYDGTGAMVSRDPNTFITTYQCATCSMSWTTEYTNGVVVTT